jgi:hypothetical protein
MKDSNLSAGGDNSVHNTLLSPPSGGKLKNIVVNRCDICRIGIGKSMLFFDGTWREYEHSSKEVYEFKYKDGIARVCLDCYEDLSAMKSPTRYIRKYRK